MCKHYEVDENGDRWLVDYKAGTRTLIPYGQEFRHIYPKYPAPVLVDEAGARFSRAYGGVSPKLRNRELN